MSKILSALSLIGLGAGGTMFASVTLQPSTPGTKETGNINVSGSIIGGKVLVGLNASTSLITANSTSSLITALQGSAPYYGVRGTASSTTGSTYAGYFAVGSPDGNGIWAMNNATTGDSHAALFESQSTAGTTVNCVNHAPTGFTTALSATIDTTSPYATCIKAYTLSGYGVDAFAPGADGVGVSGVAGGIGVYASSTTHVGLFGLTNNSAENGIQGYSPSGGAGNALHAFGTIGATGTKSLMIDHPDDPTNKYLYQFCTEGDTPQLQYRGVIRLDAKGTAIVELPDYFDKINRDPSYQLTAIGAPMPNIYVAEEARNNHFKIAGGKPGAKISWLVIGIRNDLFVQKYGAKTVRDKPEQKRGRYLMPELYNQPEQMREGYSAKLNAARTERAIAQPQKR